MDWLLVLAGPVISGVAFLYSIISNLQKPNFNILDEAKATPATAGTRGGEKVTTHYDIDIPLKNPSKLDVQIKEVILKDSKGEVIEPRNAFTRHMPFVIKSLQEADPSLKIDIPPITDPFIQVIVKGVQGVKQQRVGS